jgi:hypothetical protein
MAENHHCSSDPQQKIAPAQMMSGKKRNLHMERTTHIELGCNSADALIIVEWAVNQREVVRGSIEKFKETQLARVGGCPRDGGRDRRGRCDAAVNAPCFIDQRIDPRLAFLHRAHARLILFEVGELDLETAFNGLVVGLSCPCDRDRIARWEQQDRSLKRRR